MRRLASHGAKGIANAKGRNYKRERVIGRGSFGTAYLVRCRADSRHYVLKRLDLGHMNRKEQDEAMNEARVLEKLRRHPNIIRVREHFVEEGRLCIVMDFADGGDLAQRIEAQKDSAANSEAPELFSEDMVLDWFVQICLALKHAHDRKVLHRGPAPLPRTPTLPPHPSPLPLSGALTPHPSPSALTLHPQPSPLPRPRSAPGAPSRPQAAEHLPHAQEHGAPRRLRHLQGAPAPTPTLIATRTPTRTPTLLLRHLQGAPYTP